MTSALKHARYLNLATFRRNGTPVETPVWFAEYEGIYYAFSAGDAGKVKRLRNSPRVMVAPCDVRGKPDGEWIEGSAWIVNDVSDRNAAFRALREKYGWQMRMLDVGAALAGRIGKRAVIAIEPGRKVRAA